MTEGQKGKYIYIVVEGTCQLKKKVLLPSEQEGKAELVLRDIVLSQLDTGSVLGDEIVASKTYQYSAVVKSSEIRVLELVRFQFQELKYFGLFDDLKHLHEQYKYG